MGVCTALNLNDSSKCTAIATNKTGLFCELHARQVQGLYQGYKRRSGDLDALEKKQPKSLPKSLGSADFSTINAPETLTVLHAYLLRKFNLTTRCVMARDYHHSHFYKDTSGELLFPPRHCGAKVFSGYQILVIKFIWIVFGLLEFFSFKPSTASKNECSMSLITRRNGMRGLSLCKLKQTPDPRQRRRK